MDYFNTFLWVAFPWIAVVVCIVGMFWRYRNDQYGWTTRSTQILESRILRYSSPLFHYGMMFVIIGHIMGLAIPQSWTQAMGISNEVYHLIATIPGTIAAIAVVIGLIGLLYRRVVTKTIRLSTSTSDKVMYIFLSLAILSGTFATLSTQVFGGPHGYNYRETISPWLRELFAFHANPALMTDVPWQFKVHVIAGFTLLMVWPFTRLVHVVSVPAGYVTRPYVVYRSRDYTTTASSDPYAWHNNSSTDTQHHSVAPRKK